MQYKPPGKYFEEFNVGDEYATVSRTVTEADIVNFAGVSADFNQLHTDIEFASRTPFGKRIAHGLLGLAFVSGCVGRSGLIEGTTFAFLEISSWKFLAPNFIDDTVTVLVQVADKKETKKSDRGVVVFDIRLVNQRNEITQQGQWTIMMLRKKTV
jgi:acyl dehydratase